MGQTIQYHIGKVQKPNYYTGGGYKADNLLCGGKSRTSSDSALLRGCVGGKTRCDILLRHFQML